MQGLHRQNTSTAQATLPKHTAQLQYKIFSCLSHVFKRGGLDAKHRLTDHLVDDIEWKGRPPPEQGDKLISWLALLRQHDVTDWK